MFFQSIPMGIYAELKDKHQLGTSDVNSVTDNLAAGQSTYYELLWEQLSSAQRGTLQALAELGPGEIYSQAIRSEYRLGAASTVQKALQALDSRDILDRYKDRYFFLDPLFGL